MDKNEVEAAALAQREEMAATHLAEPMARRTFVNSRRLRLLLLEINAGLVDCFVKLREGELTDREVRIAFAQKLGMLSPKYPWAGHSPTPEGAEAATPELLEAEYYERVELALKYFNDLITYQICPPLATLLWLASHVGLDVEFTVVPRTDDEIQEIVNLYRAQ